MSHYTLRVKIYLDFIVPAPQKAGRKPKNHILVEVDTARAMNEQKMVSYLEQLKERAGEGVHLILDQAPAHKTQLVRGTANTLGIQLHFIPAGAGYLMSPLDNSYFATLQALLPLMQR